jgi:hypothetical protein
MKSGWRTAREGAALILEKIENTLLPIAAMWTLVVQAPVVRFIGHLAVGLLQERLGWCGNILHQDCFHASRFFEVPLEPLEDAGYFGLVLVREELV